MNFIGNLSGEEGRPARAIIYGSIVMLVLFFMLPAFVIYGWLIVSYAIPILLFDEDQKTIGDKVFQVLSFGTLNLAAIVVVAPWVLILGPFYLIWIAYRVLNPNQEWQAKTGEKGENIE